MTHQQYVLCVLMYLGGQILTLMWVTIPALKEKFRIANKPFDFFKWIKSDFNIIIGNLVFGAILIAIIDEVVKWKPIVLEYVKFFFLAVGAWGTSIAQEKWSPTKKIITKLIDVKTNVADAVTGGSTTVAETIIKAENAGIDATKPPTI